jgi:phage shock protein A
MNYLTGRAPEEAMNKEKEKLRLEEEALEQKLEQLRKKREALLTPPSAPAPTPEPAEGK